MKRRPFEIKHRVTGEVIYRSTTARTKHEAAMEAIKHNAIGKWLALHAERAREKANARRRKPATPTPKLTKTQIAIRVKACAAHRSLKHGSPDWELFKARLTLPPGITKRMNASQTEYTRLNPQHDRRGSWLRHIIKTALNKKGENVLPTSPKSKDSSLERLQVEVYLPVGTKERINRARFRMAMSHPESRGAIGHWLAGVILDALKGGKK